MVFTIVVLTNGAKARLLSIRGWSDTNAYGARLTYNLHSRPAAKDPCAL